MTDDFARALAEAKADAVRMDPRLAPFIDAITVTRIDGSERILMALSVEAAGSAIHTRRDLEDRFQYDLLALATDVREALCTKYRVIDPDSIDPADW